MKLSHIALTVLAISLSVHGYAEDINKIFKRVNEYASQKQYSKALSEIEWARKELERLNAMKLEEFFPKNLAGMEGDEIQKNNALGITNISRRYSKEDGSMQVQLSLTGGSSSGTNQALGGLMALGKMAAMMDNNNQDTFRVHGRTATVSKTPGTSILELSVFLESGSILKFESSTGATSEILKSMAEDMKIEELDTYMRG